MKSLILFAILSLLFACQQRVGEFVCTPCDLSCDSLTFKNEGLCPHCNMKLIKKSEIIDESKLVLNEINLQVGSGVFLLEGAEGREDRSIKIYYHKPASFSEDSRILMVLPGAGRNADSYRDAWEEESEKYSVLILSPMFEEDDYSFEEYHLCGLIRASNFIESVKFVANSNIARLDEASLSFSPNLEAKDWVFSDLDRIFDHVISSTGSEQSDYDLFGHSAGGQILHRMAIFAQESKASRIIAANAGFYTLPDMNQKMPFGIMEMGVAEDQLRSCFSKKLTILIGELDDENEDGGTLLRSERADQQGLHRNARAQYFYEFSKQKALELSTTFNWAIEVVPNVGHDHEQMGDFAALTLYGK